MEKNIKQLIEDSERGDFQSQMELKEFLIDEAEYEPAYIEDLNEKELLDHYLEYIGVCGFTDDILNAVVAAYNIHKN